MTRIASASLLFLSHRSSPYELLERPSLGAATVRGKKASSYEANFAAALDKAGYEYLFQVDYWGGRRLRGGLVLDFLIFTQPMWTPVWVNGEYWHRGERKSVDFLQQNLLLVFSGQPMGEPLILWGQDVGTPEQAEATVRSKIR